MATGNVIYGRQVQSRPLVLETAWSLVAELSWIRVLEARSCTSMLPGFDPGLFAGVCSDAKTSAEDNTT